MKHRFCLDLLKTPTPLCVASLVLIATASAADLKVYEDGVAPDDSRLQPLKDLNGHFPFQVPDSAELWQARASQLRQRILVATGLWPMLERTPLNPEIYGKTEREGFTVEKVHFESVPGHFVTGLLFRPEDGDGPRPGVLCPHGHGGRLQDYGADKIGQLIADGAEKYEASGRYPKLARCAQLARMGCTVFIFDMLGYADSRQISYELAHRFAKQRPEFEGAESWGLYSAQAEMRLQSIMGIQTWNSIRALDFLEQLPDVDPERLAVTGGSGGGTQTILLCAIDERPIVAFPQGMVSTSMQGGCTCENCSLLRIGTGNVELAALFAPKPQAMTAANDWTKDMMTDGYPQLQQLYEMLDASDDVACYPQLHFPHNYNYVTRALMYEWFNDHLGLGLESPIVEEDYEPLTPEEHTVWDEDHPAPEGGPEYERALTRYLADRSDAQMAALAPRDSSSLAEFRRVVGGALETIVGRGMPDHDDIQRTKVDKEEQDGYIYFEDILRLQPVGEEIPVISLFPQAAEWNGDVIIWVDGAGKQGMFGASGQPTPEVMRLIYGGAAVLSADLFQQGEFLFDGNNLDRQRVVENPREFAGYTYAYNHPLFARRVHDVLTLVSYVVNEEHAPKRLHLVGVGGAGPIVAIARAIAGSHVDRAAVETEGFRFAQITDYRHPHFLPGSVKYGDLPAMLALSAPHELLLIGEEDGTPELVQQAYTAAGDADAVRALGPQESIEAGVDWILAR